MQSLLCMMLWGVQMYTSKTIEKRKEKREIRKPHLQSPSAIPNCGTSSPILARIAVVVSPPVAYVSQRQ